MKQIVMLAAKFANEQEWARVMSRFGRVTLVQLEGSHFRNTLKSGKTDNAFTVDRRNNRPIFPFLIRCYLAFRTVSPR